MNIKEQRERISWTQSQLAEYMGVSERTIQNWESGETTPTKAQQSRIDEAVLRHQRYRDADTGRSDFSRLISIIEQQQVTIDRLTCIIERTHTNNI